MSVKLDLMELAAASSPGALASPAVPADAKRPNHPVLHRRRLVLAFHLRGRRQNCADAASTASLGRESCFPHAHCVSPSCTPSRGAILTGQRFARLEWGADLHGVLAAKFDAYPDLLERVGYHVGLTGKGWGPGDWKRGGPATTSPSIDCLIGQRRKRADNGRIP